MMLLIYLLLFFVRFGYSEVVVTSTASNGYVCPGNLVSYYCNATGPSANLIWLLDGNIIHVYSSGSTTFTPTSMDLISVSAFYANVSLTESFSSELTFLTLPKKMFTVECAFGNDPDNVDTEVVGEPQPVDINATKFITDKLLNVSWTQSNSRFIQYYSVRVDGELYMEVRSTFVLIVVDQYDTNKRLEVEIIAVDRCNQTSTATNVMIDLPTTTESSEATTTGMSLDKLIINDVTDTHIIVIVVLILLLVLIVGILVVAIVLAILYLINRIKKKMLRDGKLEDGKQEDSKQEDGKQEDGKQEDGKPKDNKSRSDKSKYNKSMSDKSKSDSAISSYKLKNNKSRSNMSKSDTEVDKLEMDKLEENCGTSDKPTSCNPPEAMNDDSGLATDRSQTSHDKGNTSQSSQGNKVDMGHLQNVGSNIIKVEEVQNDVPGGAEAVPGGAEANPGGTASNLSPRSYQKDGTTD